MTPSELIIGPQAPIGTTFFDTVQVAKGKQFGRAFPATPPADADAYIQSHYYDLGLTMAVAYARTNDPEFLTLFQKVCDSWWKLSWFDEGRARMWPDNMTPAPRHAGLGGLMLRAIDRPQMWDWINGYTRAHFDNWVKRHLNDPIVSEVREGAYMLHYAAWLASVLPDSFPLPDGTIATNGAALRAAYLTDVEKAATDYFGRLQYPDGSWRWDDSYYTDADGGQLRGIMQPFMVGLLLEALVDIHRITTNSTVKTSIQNQITKACRHLYLDGAYMKDRTVPSLPGIRIRGMCYFKHGGTTVNPTKYVNGDYPPDYDTNDLQYIRSPRQGISTIFSAYGYAFQLTGDPFFKTAGDELFDSAFGDTDGIHNEVDTAPKGYNQNYRMGGRYLVWRGAAPVVPPVITPPPPTPTLRKVAWPSGEAKQNAILETQWAAGYRLRKHLSGAWAEFEKV